MADVFISYRKADWAKAKALAEALKVENVDVWWDTALETGETFDDKIQAVLEKVKCVVVVWSKESVKSEWVRAESSVGRERGILVPVMIQPVNIPVPFNLLHTADLIGWHGDRSHAGYRDVVKQVKELAGKSNVPPLKPPPNRVLRSVWQTAAMLIAIAGIGAALVVFRPWDLLKAKDPAIVAREAEEARIAATEAKLAPYGVSLADFDRHSGRRLARHVFKRDTRAALDAEAAQPDADPAILTLKCAVDLWIDAEGEPLWQEAGDSCETAAKTGMPAAFHYQGMLLTEAAVYVPSDEQRKGVEMSATEEFRKAAEAGFGFAEIRYGVRLREGLGGPVDPAKAEALFKSAQAKGLPGGDGWLGRIYLSGEVASPLSAADAFALARKGADAGDAETAFWAAEKLMEGMSFGEDMDAALAYYKIAAEADDGDVSYRAATFIADTERRIAERDAAKIAQPMPEGTPAPAAPN
jgi:TIR domain